MDESESTGAFTVKDKRRFTVEGEAKEEPKPEAQPQQAAPEQPREAPAQETVEREESIPPMDFSMLILSLANSALFQMGLIKPSENEPPMKDLPAARQTIDLIALLEDKTRGNLTEQEARLIKDTLFQLRMAFVEAAK